MLEKRSRTRIELTGQFYSTMSPQTPKTNLADFPEFGGHLLVRLGPERLE